MSKTTDAEMLLIAGLIAGGIYLVSKVVGAGAALGTEIDKTLNPLGLVVSDDAHIARWIIDHPNGGYFEAGRWCTYTAIMQARQLPEGSGTPPPSGSDLAQRFPPFSGTSGDW